MESTPASISLFQRSCDLSWVLGPAAHKGAMANTALVGAVVAFLALWVAIKDKNFQKLRHRG